MDKTCSATMNLPMKINPKYKQNATRKIPSQAVQFMDTQVGEVSFHYWLLSWRQINDWEHAKLNLSDNDCATGTVWLRTS